MKPLDSILSAADALRAHPLRCALTMLGVTVAVAALIATVSIGDGARQQIADQIKSLGGNLLVVMPGSLNKQGVRLGAGMTITLTDDDARAISELSDVQVAAANIGVSAQVIANGMNWATSVLAVDPGFFEARGWEVESGHNFTPDELNGGQVALLGQTVANELFPDAEPLEQIIRVKGVPLRVVGIMAKKGQSAAGKDQDDIVLLPLDTGRSRVIGQNQIRSKMVGAILIKVVDEAEMGAVQDDVKSLLRERHRLTPKVEDDFTIMNLADIVSVKASNARTLMLLLACIAAVSLVVGAIGVASIMLVSVTERTREIGLRLALGARRRDIMIQFLLEASGLSGAGGIVGIIGDCCCLRCISVVRMAVGYRTWSHDGNGVARCNCWHYCRDVPRHSRVTA